MEYWNTHSLFPKPERNFGMNGAGVTIRSKILNGLIGQRQRFPGQENFIDVQWEFLNSTFGLFIAFHRYALNLGNDWFSIPLPIGATWGDFDIIETVDRTPRVTYEETVVRFVEGNYNFRFVEPTYYLVTARLELQKRRTITLTQLTAALGEAVADMSEDYLIVEHDKALLYYGDEGDEDELDFDRHRILLRD